METKKKKNRKPDETAANDKKMKAVPVSEAVSNQSFSSELTAPRWSVVSFESRVADGLTYDEAAQKIKQLQARKIAGLCIITDESAERIPKQR